MWLKVRCLTLLILLAKSFGLAAQPTAIQNSADIQLALKKLTVLGNVLFIAAHPDDENTAVLAYLSKERNYRTAYLAITRGSGGQNLIGSEKGVLIGMMRTQELLAARRIDGAEQFFTRAVDFGYTKSPDEAMEVWDKEKILADVVWVIRKFKPDVMISRFPGSGAGGHGHHTASGILAKEAFEIAGDASRFPEQLEYVEPWQPKRLFWNIFRRRSTRNLNTEGMIRVDVGTYNAALGKSYTEIAAESRSMHKSQGFGARGRRGSRLNYFQLLAGSETTNDLFEGIDTSWSRIPGSERAAELLMEVYEHFRPDNPAASVPGLLAAYVEIGKLEDNVWAARKRADLLDVLQSCLGLWVEATADDYATTGGSLLNLSIEVVNRSPHPLTLRKIRFLHTKTDTTVNAVLAENSVFSFQRTESIPSTISYTQPYWLVEEPNFGNFRIADQEKIGLPETASPLTARFEFSLYEENFALESPVLFRWTDRVIGEQYRHVEIRPAVTANFAEKVYLFPDGQGKEIRIKLKGHRAGARGNVRLKLPAGWLASPETFPFTMADKYGELSVAFSVQPPPSPSIGSLGLALELDDKILQRSLQEIDHPHIPKQSLFPKATAKLIRLETSKIVANIGYIMGAGDEVPHSLVQLGYTVALLEDASLETMDLSRFDAIVTGIRAYNTRKRMVHYQDKLLDYVRDGGTMVVQYNVAFGLAVNNIGPYPFGISRDRVTLETAEISFVNPDHALLNYPNKITAKDFDGWVQERGLYFAGEWDDRYETILSSNDPGEEAKVGGMLYARYGKGVFIYSGYSWFRQLPAGVPGAYRLFVNLISAGRSNAGSY